MSVLLPLGVALGALLGVRLLYFRVSVRGASMLPTLLPGDRVLARRVVRRRLRAGDVVVCRHYLPVPAGLSTADDSGPAAAPAWVIKRVAAVPGDPVPPVGIPEAATVVPDGAVVLLGDNPAASADSRQTGFVPLARVRGKVVRLPRRPTAAAVPGRPDRRGGPATPR